MDYRGIVTQGFHNDAGGQTAIRIVSLGYIGVLADVVFVASPRKIVITAEDRVIDIRDSRVITASSGSRTVKGTA